MSLYVPNTSDSIDNNILSKSSINLRLDILSASATKKKPWCESTGDFYFWAEQSLLKRRPKIKKPADTAGGCRAFSLLSSPKRIASKASNPPAKATCFLLLMVYWKLPISRQESYLQR